MPVIQFGKGTIIGVAASSSGAFTTLSQAVSIQPMGETPVKVDQTHLASALKKYRPGLVDPQPAVISVFYDRKDADHSALKTALESGTLRWFRITTYHPDTGSSYATETFSAYVGAMTHQPYEVDGNIVADVELWPDSLPVIA